MTTKFEDGILYTLPNATVIRLEYEEGNDMIVGYSATAFYGDEDGAIYDIDENGLLSLWGEATRWRVSKEVLVKVRAIHAETKASIERTIKPVEQAVAEMIAQVKLIVENERRGWGPERTSEAKHLWRAVLGTLTLEIDKQIQEQIVNKGEFHL